MPPDRTLHVRFFTPPGSVGRKEEARTAPMCREDGLDGAMDARELGVNRPLATPVGDGDMAICSER